MSGNHDSPPLLRELSNTYDVYFKNFDSFDNWGLFMFNTKKENSSSGILNDSELLYFDEILENNLYENIIVFLHHHPVLIGSPVMDTMVIENADLLLKRIKKSNKVKAVLYDISDDCSLKSRKNYTLNHLIERIKIYNEENFNYDIITIQLKDK